MDMLVLSSSSASNFLRLEYLALAPNALRFVGVWIRPPSSAAVRSVQRLWMAANAYFVWFHWWPPSGGR